MASRKPAEPPKEAWAELEAECLKIAVNYKEQRTVDPYAWRPPHLVRDDLKKLKSACEAFLAKTAELNLEHAPRPGWPPEPAFNWPCVEALQHAEPERDYGFAAATVAEVRRLQTAAAIAYEARPKKRGNARGRDETHAQRVWLATEFKYAYERCFLERPENNLRNRDLLGRMLEVAGVADPRGDDLRNLLKQVGW